MKHLFLALALAASTPVVAANSDCSGPLSQDEADAQAAMMISALKAGWDCRAHGTSVKQCITDFANQLGGD